VLLVCCVAASAVLPQPTKKIMAIAKAQTTQIRFETSVIMARELSTIPPNGVASTNDVANERRSDPYLYSDLFLFLQ
jgi:hypothetical protein